MCVGRDARDVRSLLGGVEVAARMGASVLACCALTLTGGAAWSPAAHADQRQAPASARGQGGFDGRVWPVEGHAGAPRPQVVRGWKPPPQPWAAGHRGVDLAAPRGSPVRAAADGTVSFAGKVAGRSLVSIALSETGRPPLRTTYEPVRPAVRKGQKVRAGQRVGTVADGPFHCRRGCLHWGARRGEQYLDPLSLLPADLLRGSPSRLLPVFGIPVPRSTTGVADGTGSGRKAGASRATGREAVLPAEATERQGPANTSAAVGTVGHVAGDVPDSAFGPYLSVAAALVCGACGAHRGLARRRRCMRDGQRWRQEPNTGGSS